MPRRRHWNEARLLLFHVGFLSVFSGQDLASLGIGRSLPFCAEKRSPLLSEIEEPLLLCSESNRSSSWKHDIILVLRGDFPCQQIRWQARASVVFVGPSQVLEQVHLPGTCGHSTCGRGDDSVGRQVDTEAVADEPVLGPLEPQSWFKFCVHGE